MKKIKIDLKKLYVLTWKYLLLNNYGNLQKSYPPSFCIRHFSTDGKASIARFSTTFVSINSNDSKLYPITSEIIFYTDTFLERVSDLFKNRLSESDMNIFIMYFLIHEFMHYNDHLKYYIPTVTASSSPASEKNYSIYINDIVGSKKTEQSADTQALLILYNIISDIEKLQNTKILNFIYKNFIDRYQTEIFTFSKLGINPNVKNTDLYSKDEYSYEFV